MAVTDMMKRAICGVIAAIAIAASPLRATEERPMPVFSVTRADDTAVPSTQLNAASQYVLIYVRPNCRPCDRLLDLLAHWNAPELTSRVVFLYSGTGAAAAEYAAAHVPAEAGQAIAYGDPTGDALRALKLTGAPVIIGVRGGRLLWSVSGVLNDATAVESLVKTWITQ